MAADRKKGIHRLALSMLALAILLLILLLGPWNNQRKPAIVPGDFSSVDRIVLMDSYHSTELVRGDSSWYLFGTEPVHPAALANLAVASTRLEISGVVDSEGLIALKDEEGEARTISYYRGDKVLLTYVLKPVSGRFLLLPADSERAFFVSVPGYSGLDLGRVFSATPDHYRQHLLVDLIPSDISRIEIELASGQAFRFIQDQKGQIRCEAGNAATILPEGEGDELALKLLFSYFTSIRYEQRAGITADSVRAGGVRKMATIAVESFSAERHALQVFPYRETAGSEPHLFRALVLHNDEQDAIFMNYIYLDVLMRDLSHYFGEK